jgi:hypothetical protein
MAGSGVPAAKEHQMQVINRPTRDAPARVLALLVAANGHIRVDELTLLERLDAFARLGVSRSRFIELAQRCLEELGGSLREQSWLRVSDLVYVNGLLDAVDDEALRMLVCRLCAAAITADGHVSREERMLYNHALARWRINSQQVSEAIRRDPLH